MSYKTVAKQKAYCHKYYLEHKSKFSEYTLKSRYKMTLPEYQTLVNKQGGKCAICETIGKSTFHIDHDHKTGRVRGLLCARCNGFILPVVEQRRDLIPKAIAYLGGF